MCDRTLAENAQACKDKTVVGRPLPEMADSVVALAEKAAAMLDEIRGGLIWTILTYKPKAS